MLGQDQREPRSVVHRVNARLGLSALPWKAGLCHASRGGPALCEGGGAMNTRLTLSRTFHAPTVRRGRLLLLTFLAALSTAGSLAPRALAAGSMIDLGSLGTGCGSSGAAINDLGQVAGASCGRAFRWTRATGMQDLGTLNAPGKPDLGGTAAEAINVFGQVTGSSWSWVPHLPQAFLWTPTGVSRASVAATRRQSTTVVRSRVRVPATRVISAREHSSGRRRRVCKSSPRPATSLISITPTRSTAAGT